MYTSLSLPKIKRTCELLRAASRERVSDITELYALEVFDYKTSNEAPDGDYRLFDGVISGKEKRYFIKADITVPEDVEGYEYTLEISTGVHGWDANNPQLILYLDGYMATGLDVNHTTMSIAGGKTYKSVCYLYSGAAEVNAKLKYRLVRVNKAVESLYYDMQVPYEACRDVYPENSGEYAAVLGALESAANLLDLRNTSSREFYESVERASEYMKNEFYGKLCSTEGKPTVNYVGHTHIDVEWLWDRRQTREKIQRSAATAVNLMKKYPEYIFTLSQPELYRYLKEEAPEKYAEVKALIKEGRWEPEGGLYLECDCNLISGESMVRQFMHGKRFFRDEFGVESRICLLPDVFGYSAAMPQIMRKSGIDYFVTSKISWNDTNTMPYDAFIWRGIDGSEIFTSFITGQNYDKKNAAAERGCTYVGTITSQMTYGTWNRFGQKSYTQNALSTYGFGDGGGGPTAEMLEHGRRLSKGLPGLPVARLTTLKDHLDRAHTEFTESAKKLGRVPRWVGELYLEYHRGTYTTAARNKRANRKCELALQRTEALSATDTYFGGTYPRTDIWDKWTMLLHNQFHDIIPGSSIKSVYEFSEADYAEIGGFTKRTTEEKLLSLAEKIGTDGGILVYNPQGYDRVGYVKIDSQTVSTKEAIPAYGYAVIKKPVPVSKVSVNGREIENKYYRVKLDEYGRIVSLYDKREGREAVKPGEAMNEYRAYEDYPEHYDAWELDEYLRVKAYPIHTPVSFTKVKDGERAGIRIERQYMSSKIEETVWLYSEDPRIDLENRIDWHEKHQILKLAFPVNVNASEATYEIQFGSINRPTHANTSWDSAKFEVCAHRWADISEYGYGVALLNDCKYGHSAEGSTLTLTCIKCPSYPNPVSDEGLHEFTCALLPHTGAWREGGVVRAAHAFNQPLVAREIPASRGELPERFSVVSVREQNVVIDTLKCAESSDGTVVRLYEAFGGAVTAHIKVAEGYKRAYLCDLMENKLERLNLLDGEAELPMGAYEIATVMLEK